MPNIEELNNNPKINTESSEIINGESSAVINSDYEGIELTCESTNWIITGRIGGGSIV